MATFVAHPWAAVRVGDFLISAFQDPKWTQFRGAVAFARRSGTRYIAPHLATFARRTGASVNLSIGVDLCGSTYEGVNDLIDATFGFGKLWVYRNLRNTFHPKLFLFRNELEADFVVGSGNLTKGGLFENSEAFVKHALDLSKPDDAALLASVEAALDRWSIYQPKLCLPLDYAVLKDLNDSGDIPLEAVARAATQKAMGAITGKAKKKSPFGSVTMPKAPAPPPPAKPPAGAPAAAASSTTPFAVAKGHSFGMTLQNTDVGVGQKTPGKQRRSPEIFIPLRALDQLPNFWGWKSTAEAGSQYKADPSWRAKHAAWVAKHSKKKSLARPLDKLDWPKVRIKLAGHAGLLEAAIWFNPVKKDIRIRQEVLRSAGAIGDILLIRQAPKGASYEYDMQVVKTSDPAFSATQAKLATKVPNSPKQIGYF